MLVPLFGQIFMMVYKLLSDRMALMFISTTLLILGIVENCTATPFESKIKEYVSSTSKCDEKYNSGNNSDEGNCSTSCQCGVLNRSKIIGGTEVNPMRKYPWQVGIFWDGYNIYCGGTIINDRWILTAAHCIVWNYTNCEISLDSSHPIRVVVGEHNQMQTSDDDLNTKEYSVKTYIKHPNLNCRNNNYDFALLELTEVIPFNNIIRPICLPKDDSKTYANQTGIVTGWGRTSDDGPISSFLREIQVPILANNKCKGWGTIAPMKLCYDIVSNKSACQGDSGGPVHVIENNKYVQVGVVSYGHYSCVDIEYPKVSARVSKVLPWIATTTANGKKCD